MKCRILAVVLWTAACAGTTSASAATIYSTGFENPPFAAGGGVLGTDGWSLAIPPFLNPSAATVTNSVAQAGAQSMEVRGSNLVGSGGTTAPYDAVGSYRRPIGFNAAANGYPRLVVEADVRLDGPAVATGDLAAASVAARSGILSVGELELSSDGVAYAYTGNGGSPALFTSSALDLSQWHHLALEIDFLHNETSFFVNGNFLGKFTHDPLNTSDVLVRGALVTYARPDDALAGFDRDDFVYRFDNFSVSSTAVPEPASLTIFGASATLLALVRRRVKRTGARLGLE